jgi:predicted DNA-binding transcriptional regulator YafY
LNKTDRHIFIIRYLRDIKRLADSVPPHHLLPTSATVLAELTDASVRTIERDFIELKKKGAPIRIERGRYGGALYTEDPVEHLLVLTDDEAFALRDLAQIEVNLQSGWTGTHSALSKLNAILRGATT